MTCQVGAALTFTALRCDAIVQSGDDVAPLIRNALHKHDLELQPGDVVVVTSKVISRSEGCFVDLGSIHPSPRAIDLAATTGHDPRLVELILQESTAVSRAAPGVLIVRHRIGIVSANAGIDRSNALPKGADPASGPWVLRLPEDPDRSAHRLLCALDPRIGVIITDSLGRPFRLGSVGHAIGCSGIDPLQDHTGRIDLVGRPLEHTRTAIADPIAAAADLVAGQSDERRPFVHVRGLHFGTALHSSARSVVRPEGSDLFA